jgi:hypothetical protein
MVGFDLSADRPGRGSAIPPECHSLPRPFESLTSVDHINKKPANPEGLLVSLAEKEGFEPSMSY